MKTNFYIFVYIIIALLTLEYNANSQINNNDYIIKKKNGNIILAYKAFEDFLESDRSWSSYKSILLDAYPSVRKVHNRQIEWGSIDTIRFPDEIKYYKKEDFKKFIARYDLNKIIYLYDSVIARSRSILSPVNFKQVDLCFFLPYGSCFVIPEDTVNTIFISMRINPNDAEKILAHEYAHILHIDRRPKEPLSLKREIVSEGMAVFLTNRIIKNIEVSNSVPFMSKNSFEWCLNNEKLIKDSIKLELNDTTMRLFKRYISDGDFAEPPLGFVQKTGYFIGYRIIEKCFIKGMPIEDICSLDSEAVIKKSGYFE
ncbi:MAG: hypothetical protein JXA06_01825 [Bacteroidetes bacterium]|nr:hypothetical protein [Bacteroidota bacterium]